MITTRRAFLSAFAIAPFACNGHRHAYAAVPPDPAVVGKWSSRIAFPNVSRHTTILPPTSTVLMMFARGPVGTQCWTWDSRSGAIADASMPWLYDAMCGGNVLLDDGRYAVYGGVTGANQTARFDLASGWKPGPELTYPRYYPSSLRLGDGLVYTFFGRHATVDVYDPHDYRSAIMTRLPATANQPEGPIQLYPRVHRLPDGAVFMCGTEKATKIFTPRSASWRDVAPMNAPRRFNGTSVPLPGSGLKFLVLGGGDSTPLKTAEIIDLGAPAPKWRYTAPLAHARNFPNTVVLPDGAVLAVGGQGSPVPYAAEIFDPVKETWRTLAPGTTKRDYHSTAILLPDGRVLSSGGDNDLDRRTGEVFSPPYLFKGDRPVIALADSVAAHGATVRLVAADAAAIRRITLVRPGPSTHGINLEQQHYELSFTPSASDVLDVTLPSNPFAAPTGWYMLFALDAAGVPSVAEWIRIRSEASA